LSKKSKGNKASRRSRRPTCAIVSLGCPKNLVDSERMLSLLDNEGFQWVADPEGADLAVVNTCGFLDIAREESLDVIGQMVELKQRGRLGAVLVAGCLVERDREALLAACPGIDRLLGVFSREAIGRAAGELLAGKGGEPARFDAAPSCPPPDMPRVRLTPPHVAYLRIAEGCDRSCTFCTIPQIRGPLSSKPIEQIVAEAEALAAEGTRELILVAQDTTAYGVDLYGEPRLVELLAQLDQVSGIAWIRLMYLYPDCSADALVRAVSESDKVLPYIDLPLQHINDRLLRRMGRRVDRRQTEALIERLREGIEGLVLRSTLIVGFPGETQREFEELLDFVGQVRLERLGVFAYRPEPETPSARLEGHVDEEKKQRRREQVLHLQQQIAFDWSESQTGRRIDVIVDGPLDDEPAGGTRDTDGAWLGRTYADAPEIDPVVFLTGENLAPGQIVPAEIVAPSGYDLIAVATGAPR
jgi:ribosomal protein S12 methylthiotransferase